MTKSSEIKEKSLQLQYQMEQLEKQRQEALVQEGKAYYCKKPRCNAFVDKEKEGVAVIESGLCASHFHVKCNEEQTNLLMKKLKFAKIVDIELDGRNIETITVSKNGMLYDLKAEYDRDFDDNAKIVYYNDRKNDKQIDLEDEKELDVKPWQKERHERPLVK